MSLVFSQYKMINWLVPKVAELSAKLEELEKEEGEYKRRT
jgi:hypothetical protein